MKYVLLSGMLALSLSGCSTVQEREAVRGELSKIWIETIRDFSKAAGKTAGQKIAK